MSERELSLISYPPRPAGLYEPIRYALAEGGKRIRPALVMMACNLFTETVTVAKPAALAVELFHNFTLLHDDIMDNADGIGGLRRTAVRYGFRNPQRCDGG